MSNLRQVIDHELCNGPLKTLADRLEIAISEKYGRDLYRALVERYPRSESPFLAQTLPDPATAPRNVTLPLERLKEFNADYSELAGFAAWVCGVDLKTFCRADMMRATGAWKEIAARIRAANSEDE